MCTVTCSGGGSGNNNNNSNGRRRRRRKRSTGEICETGPVESEEQCKVDGGYCMESSKCPGSNYTDNKCPGGENIKCCLSAPFQEPECMKKRGTCKDVSETCDGEFLTGFCPNQPESIKCCRPCCGLKKKGSTRIVGGTTTDVSIKSNLRVSLIIQY